MIVPKKNGKYRVCVDYRRLNKKIIRDRFPMPRIDDRIDALADARVFSVLDLKGLATGQGDWLLPCAGCCRKSSIYIVYYTGRPVRISQDSVRTI